MLSYQAIEGFPVVKEGPLFRYSAQFFGFFKKWKSEYFRLYPSHLVCFRQDEVPTIFSEFVAEAHSAGVYSLPLMLLLLGQVVQEA